MKKTRLIASVLFVIMLTTAMMVFSSAESNHGNIDKNTATTKNDSILLMDALSNGYPEGIYKVGTGVPAGEYILISKSYDGYFSISTDAEENAVIANDNFGYVTYVTAYEDTYLKLSRCTAIPYTDDIVFNPIESEWLRGTFKIGKDLPVGVYVLISETSNGYYAILSGTSGSNIIDNDNFGAVTYVVLTEDIYLEINNCKVIPYSNNTVYNPVNNGYVKGMYQVGKDMPAGTYKLTSISGGYYAIYDFPQGNILSNDAFGQGIKYITVRPDQFIKLSRTKVENND